MPGEEADRGHTGAHRGTQVLDYYAVGVEDGVMKQMLSERTAAALVALTGRPSGLRLAELARLTGSPLSSAQRTVEALLDEGLLVREGDRRPRYRMAPEAPADALATLAGWRLTRRRAAQIRQQTAAMEGDANLPRLDLETRLREAMTSREAAEGISDMAERLVWWQRAEQTLRRPERLIAQAMAIGTSEDADRVEAVFGTEAMRRVLAGAPAGIFDPRRWDYWHLRFGYRRTPPLPTRPA